VTSVILLHGDPFARGVGQARACPEAAEDVRRVVRSGLAEAPLDSPASRTFLASQRDWMHRNAPEAMAEIAGIAEGFGLGADEVFAHLHLNILADFAAAPAEAGGCSAFARHGLVAKNRDVRSEQARLQRLFVHRDPSWGGRSLLCLGSLGAPGAYSSGMNSEGLAVADTQIPTLDHGPGMLRYVLMTRLLTTCARVAEALHVIRALAHAGGGSLVLADASGAAAAVELRHHRVDVEQAPWVARTNHYLLTAGDPLPPVTHSAARLAVLREAVAAGRPPEDILAHQGPGEPLCRPATDPSPTISGAIWDTGRLAGRIAFGPPASAPWRNVRFADGQWRETRA